MSTFPPDGEATGGEAPERGARESAAEQDARHIIEEATRLIDALGGLSPDHNSTECRICPLCRLLATMRELRPEVLDHLTLAAQELIAAVREFAVPRDPPVREEPMASGDGAPADLDGDPADPDDPSDLNGYPGEDPGDLDFDPVMAIARPPARPAVQHIEITD